MMFYGIDSPQCLEWLSKNCVSDDFAKQCESVKQLRIKLAKDDPYKSVMEKMKDY